MKNRIILILALFLTLTGFRSDEKAMKEGDVKVIRSANAIPQPPKFARGLKNLTVIEGKDAVFSADLDYIDPSCRITWYKDGQDITTNKRYQTKVDGNRVMLVIPKATEADQGMYGVKAVNGLGSVESSATLKVEQ